MKYFNFVVDMLCYVLYYRYTDKRGGEKMNNMRSYSLAFYPETKKKLEAIKDREQLTWDELFNYLMEVENKSIQEKVVK